MKRLSPEAILSYYGMYLKRCERILVIVRFPNVTSIVTSGVCDFRPGQSSCLESKVDSERVCFFDFRTL